jgi:non-specific serine/threonine protein kinase
MSSAPLAATAASLPTPRTRLVGRQCEVAAARALLLDEAVPLLTLTGPGGIGKTHLAQVVAATVSDSFANGVVFVDLAPIRDAALVVPAVAQALGIREVGQRPLAELVSDALKPRQVLLLLDNCEQVLEAAPALAALLADCPALQLLATSRAPLRVRGEQLLPVPPLALPDQAPAPTLAELAQIAAVVLFVQRARAANPAFALTADNAASVVEICARLDGLPLALELAAVRLKLLSPQALLALLTDRLTPLTFGTRDAPPRQQTLRDTIAWSYDLLDAAPRALFRRLAVFPGGFTLGAAAALAGTAPDTVLDGVSALVDQSLLRQEEAQAGMPRFAMLETIRDFGLERLKASGEYDAARRQHAEYVVLLVDRPERPPGLSEQRCWLDQLEAVQDDIRAALAWGLDCDVALALRLGAALVPFWPARGHLSEGRSWLERGLERGVTAPAPARLQALNGATRLAAAQGDADQAVALAEETLTLASAIGDRRSIGRALDQLATVALLQSDYARASALLAEVSDIALEVGDKAGLAAVRHGLAVIAGRQGERDQATTYSEEALVLYRELGEHVRVAMVLLNLGTFADYGGDQSGATSRYAESLALYCELKNTLGIGRVLTKLGNLAARSGDYTAATRYYAEALPMHRDHGERPSAAEALAGLGVVAAKRDSAEQAARLFGAAKALGEAAGYVLHAPIQLWHDETLAAVRAALGESRFAAAWDAGRGLSLEQAVAEALVVAAAPGHSATLAAAGGDATVAVPNALSQREREVLRLVAQRLTDKEIGEALFISPRTAMTHVSHILAKLGVASRREAAAVAARDGLI